MRPLGDQPLSVLAASSSRALTGLRGARSPRLAALAASLLLAGGAMAALPGLAWGAMPFRRGDVFLSISERTSSPALPVHDGVVVRDQSLLGDVVRVKAEVRLAQLDGAHRVARHQPLKLRTPDGKRRPDVLIACRRTPWMNCCPGRGAS